MTKFLIALLFTVFWLGQPCASEAVNETEYVLEQDFGDLGDQTVHIYQDSVRVDCHSHSFSTICKAPDWRVYCFRTKEKKIWISNLDSFHGLLLFNPFSTSPYKPGESVKGEAVTYVGVKGVVLRPPHEQFWLSYATNTMTDNPKVGEFLNRYYYVQNSNMVPLYKKNLIAEKKRKYDKNWLTGDATADLRSQPRLVLTTSSFKKVAYKASDFEVPQKYQVVHYANDILISNTDKVKIDDMMDNLGFTTDFDAHAKPKH